MTAAELIKKLSRLPQDARVVVAYDSGCARGHIEKIVVLDTSAGKEVEIQIGQWV